MKYRSYKKGHQTTRPALKVSDVNEEDKEEEVPRSSPNLVIQPMAIGGMNEVMQDGEETNQESETTPMNKKIEQLGENTNENVEWFGIENQEAQEESKEDLLAE